MALVDQLFVDSVIEDKEFDISYKTKGAAGMDLRAKLDTPTLTFPPFGRALIKTGVKLAIPEGYLGYVNPRSGLAYKKGLTVLNAPGTIDSDFRGEIGVILVNLSAEEATIEYGERIAQIVFHKVENVVLIDTVELPDTDRGAGGFGSTGEK